MRRIVLWVALTRKTLTCQFLSLLCLFFVVVPSVLEQASPHFQLALPSLLCMLSWLQVNPFPGHTSHPCQSIRPYLNSRSVSGQPLLVTFYSAEATECVLLSCTPVTFHVLSSWPWALCFLFGEHLCIPQKVAQMSPSLEPLLNLSGRICEKN